MGWFFTKKKVGKHRYISTWCSSSWEDIQQILDVEPIHSGIFADMNNDAETTEENNTTRKKLQEKFGFNRNFEHPVYYLLLENTVEVIDHFFASGHSDRILSSVDNLLHAVFIRGDQSILKATFNRLKDNQFKHIYRGDWHGFNFGSVPILHLAFQHGIDKTTELLKLGFSPSVACENYTTFTSLDYFVYCYSNCKPSNTGQILEVLHSLIEDERRNPKWTGNASYQIDQGRGKHVPSHPIQALLGLPGGKHPQSVRTRTKNGFYYSHYNVEAEKNNTKMVSDSHSIETEEWQSYLVSLLIDSGFPKLSVQDFSSNLDRSDTFDFKLLEIAVDLNLDELKQHVFANPNLPPHLLNYCLDCGLSIYDTKKVGVSSWGVNEIKMWDFIIRLNCNLDTIRQLIGLISPNSEIERDAILAASRWNPLAGSREFEKMLHTQLVQNQ